MANIKIDLATILFIVTSIFALFGGFLVNISPPVSFGPYIVGTVQLICLLTGFIILSQRKKSKKSNFLLTGIISGIIALIACISYYYMFQKNTCLFNGNRIVKGTTMTPEMYTSCEGLGIKKDDCEYAFLRSVKESTNYEPEEVWVAETILKNEIYLFLAYLILTLTVCICIFSTTESFQTANTTIK